MARLLKSEVGERVQLLRVQLGDSRSRGRQKGLTNGDRCDAPFDRSETHIVAILNCQGRATSGAL
eukprot:5827273-Amphidinium_carterae.1